MYKLLNLTLDLDLRFCSHFTVKYNMKSACEDLGQKTTDPRVIWEWILVEVRGHLVKAKQLHNKKARNEFYYG